MKPADASVNTARSNKIYDISDTSEAKYNKPGHPEAKLTSEDTDSWEPPAEVRGEIARAAFYMDVRYSGDKANENNLQLTNDLSAINSDSIFFGKLDTLLEWHIADPVDTAERSRNDLLHFDYRRTETRLWTIQSGWWQSTVTRGGAMRVESAHNLWRESPVRSKANILRPVPSFP